MTVAESLRSRQKTQRRVTMLTAARGLFVERGYSKTTMDAIAARAEVGVATVYTYFVNKEGVFAELAKMDMAELQLEGEELLKSLPDDPVESVVKLLRIYNKVYDFITYEVVMDFTIEVKHEGPLRKTGRWISDWKVDQLSRALVQGQMAGKVSDSLSIQDAAQIIHDLADHQYQRVRPNESRKRTETKLNKWVSILFESWR